MLLSLIIIQVNECYFCFYKEKRKEEKFTFSCKKRRVTPPSIINKIFMFADKKHSKRKGRESDQREKEKRIEATMESPKFKSYIDNLKKFNNADAVIIVLDARNPFSCIYAPYEDLLGKKMWIVINKIDLAPRESVIAWYNVFCRISHTFAVNATVNIDPVLEFLSSQKKEDEGFSIVVTGVDNVGKETIASRLKSVEHVSVEVTKPWSWIRPTSDLVVLGSLDISSIADNRIAHARDFISRCSIHSMMETFGVTFYNEPDVIMKQFDAKKNVAALEFFKQMQNGKYLFYTAAPCIPADKELQSSITETQKRSFLLSKKIDQHERCFIALGSATQTSIIESLLPALHHLAAKNEEAAKAKQK